MNRYRGVFLEQYRLQVQSDHKLFCRKQRNLSYSQDGL